MPKVSADRVSREALTREGHWSAPALGQAAEMALGIVPREVSSMGEIKAVQAASRRAANWPTPTAMDHSRGLTIRPHDTGTPLPQMVARAIWPTPTSRDHKDGSYTPNVPVNSLLGRAVWPTPTSLAPAKNGQNEAGNSAGLVAIRGLALSGSPEQTEKPGALAPEFVAWLMGYPETWLECAPVTPSKNAGRKKAQKVIPVMLSCERCGATDGLSRHHKDRNTENNSLPNLEVLCRPCHVAEHMTDGTWGTGPTPSVECAICGEFFVPASHSERAMICSTVCLSELGRRAARKRWHGESLSLYSRTEFLTASASSERSAMRSSRKSPPSSSSPTSTPSTTDFLSAECRFSVAELLETQHHGDSNMSFELTIKADNPADFLKSVAGIYGAMFAGRVAAPVQVEAGLPAATVVVAPGVDPTLTTVLETTNAPAPEKVDPPKKPRGRPPKSAEPVDLKADLQQSIAETEARISASAAMQTDIEDHIRQAAQQQQPDRETVRQKLLQYLDGIRVADGDEAMRPALAAVFKRMKPPIAEMKVKAVPDERLGELDAAIDAEKAARSAPEV